MDIVYRILGLLLVVLVLFDVFKSVIVPGIASTNFRVAPFLLGKMMWPLYKGIALNRSLKNASNAMLETFGPLSFVVLVVVWLLILVSGYALLLFSFRSTIAPHIHDFGEAIYFAGASVLTIIGYGDVETAAPITRLVVLVGALSGLVLMALVISYLFTIQNWLQVREQTVNTLRSRAGSPSSGLVLLLRYKELNIVQTLGSSFLYWEGWAASILESHRAYPVLIYFRSTNRQESWLSAMGAMLDAASLLLTSVDDVVVGEADLFYWMSCTVVQDICEHLGVTGKDGVFLTKKEYLDGVSVLADVGFKMRTDERAWLQFSARRAGYMGNILALAEAFAMPVHTWIEGLPILRVDSEASSEASALTEDSR